MGHCAGRTAAGYVGLRFRKRGRWLLWAFCILSAPVLAWYLFSVHGVWFPVMTPVTGVLCVALAGSLIPGFPSFT
ncbi:MAG: hypothetical protein ACLSCR_13810 [Akkermansia sp.]